ncbi:MAG: hypothetical protein GXY20_10475 [Clostridiales bacterium]|jgi:hypothetical protein|nr:hypothetical protein [Clostridiales bacterium]
MKRPNYLEQIKKRIDTTEPGTVFIPSDFFDIAEAVKVNMCLNRLTENGELNRIMRGVFAKPRYSNLLNTNVPPRSDDMAKAIARNYGWTVVPCGDTALNMLGLSTQVPTVWLYVSDGPYKTYEADGITLKFKHTDNKNEITAVSYQTALVIQALKALGKENITDKEIRKLSKILSQSEKQKMLAESQRITEWVYGYIKKICVEG